MTRINRIVMNGFKSFANKTELEFGTDFNCVLGPNGSGKSNIIDGICFVLGKGSAKGLRAEKATNLIYNGGKTKKPSKQGEVSIYFDNSKGIFPTDEKEVKISRIVKQSGQSIYKINDKKRTRQQVLELLSVARINPDGYNIILQGDIIEFVEMSPERRRRIIEEVSGISIYEEKKQKAMNEMNKVDARLQEAEIVLSERKVHLDELHSDRNQALKYKEVQDLLKRTRSTLLNLRITNKRQRLEKLLQIQKVQKDKLEKLNLKISDTLGKISDKKAVVRSISEEIEKKGEKEQLKVHKEVEQLKVDIATHKTMITSIENEIERINQRKSQLNSSMNELTQKISSMMKQQEMRSKENSRIESQIEMINKKIVAFREKNNLDNASALEKDIEKLDQTADDYQQEIQGLREKQQDLFRENDQLELQISSLDDKIMKVKEIESEHHAELKNLKRKKEDFKKATNELSKLLNEDSSVAAQLANARSKLVDANERLSRFRTQQSHLTEKVSKNIAVEKIIENKSRLKGVHDIISNLGRTSQKFSLALEIAAGPRIKSIVVDDDAVAARCIKFLKDNRSGIATFVPMNKIRKGKQPSPEVKTLLEANGVHGLAIDLVEYDHDYENVFSYVFGDTIVVDSLATARRLGIGKARMVTLDGDLCEISGAMHGGFRQKQRKYGFRQDELIKEISAIEKEVDDYSNLVSKLEQVRADTEEEITKLRQFKAELEGDIIRMEKGLHLDSSDLQSTQKVKSELIDAKKKVQKDLDEITAKISELNKRLAELKIEKQSIRAKMNELRNPRLLAELNTYEQKKDELKVQLAESRSELKNLQMQIDTILKPEQDNTQKILRQHDKEIDDFKK